LNILGARESGERGGSGSGGEERTAGKTLRHNKNSNEYNVLTRLNKRRDVRGRVVYRERDNIKGDGKRRLSFPAFE
jgi:hypothetical protein